MELQTKCPICGSDHVRLVDNEPVSIPIPYEGTDVKVLYQWDKEIYALALCDNCQHTYTVQGTITW